MADTPSNLPPFVTWPSFPFEGHLRTKRLEPLVSTEPPREGEDPESCKACNTPDEEYIWVGDRWRVKALDRPSGLPVVLILELRSHLDLGDLPNLMAAELGVMTVRLERAIRSIDGIARVHVNRWGDGAAHMHMWFLARPTGRLQLRGSFLSLWDDIIEPIAESDWRENLAHVAAWLAEFEGRAIAEPPRIEWHAPSRYGDTGTWGSEGTDGEQSAIGRASVPESSAGNPELVAQGAAADHAPADEAATVAVAEAAVVHADPRSATSESTESPAQETTASDIQAANAPVAVIPAQPRPDQTADTSDARKPTTDHGPEAVNGSVNGSREFADAEPGA